MDSRRDELSSLATGASENTRRCRIEERIVRKSLQKQALEEQVKREQDIAREESVVRKRVEKQALEERVKQEQDIARQREDLEELRRQYRSLLFEEEDLQDLKELEFKGPEKRESRSTPSLGKDMWNQLKRTNKTKFCSCIY